MINIVEYLNTKVKKNKTHPMDDCQIRASRCEYSSRFILIVNSGEYQKI